MNDEELRLLKENNTMLKQIIQYINRKNSNNNIAAEDFKSFMIDVVANAIVNRR